MSEADGAADQRCLQAIYGGDFGGIPIVVRCDLQEAHDGQHEGRTPVGRVGWSPFRFTPDSYSEHAQ